MQTKITNMNLPKGLSKEDFTVFECEKNFDENIVKNVKHIVLEWDTFVEVNSLNSAFKDCPYLESVVIRCVNFKNVSDLSEMFKNCKNLKEVTIQDVVFGENLVLDEMFKECTSLQTVNLKGSFSNVKSMFQMFCNCSALKDIDLSEIEINKETRCRLIFENCISLEKLILKNCNEETVFILHDAVLYNCNDASTILDYDDDIIIDDNIKDFRFSLISCRDPQISSDYGKLQCDYVSDKICNLSEMAKSEEIEIDQIIQFYYEFPFYTLDKDGHFAIMYDLYDGSYLELELIAITDYSRTLGHVKARVLDYGTYEDFINYSPVTFNNYRFDVGGPYRFVTQYYQVRPNLLLIIVRDVSLDEYERHIIYTDENGVDHLVMEVIENVGYYHDIILGYRKNRDIILR